jgi:hypothetical protein
MTEKIIVDPVETTEVNVDPLLATKLLYVDNLKKEIQELQKQKASLQYQLDIRVTALTMYQSALEVKEEEEPKENGKDKEDESNS